MNLFDFPIICSNKPFTRWWWFSGPIHREEIDEQLDWLVQQGFGGVEIAWVFPQPGTAADQGPEFLDSQWKELVLYTLQACRNRDMGCDLTFGTLWPFGGSFLPEEFASKTLTGLSSQRLRRSWESRYSAVPGYILDHIQEKAFEFYSDYLLSKGFQEFAAAAPISFFSDSWEVEGRELSYTNIFQDFHTRFHYRLEPFAGQLASHPEVQFDYRVLIADQIIENFYKPYTTMCHNAGALARMQCHGTPTDILAAYALVDIPETETLLFDPDFALLAASAAAVFDKPVVSSESFTCIYGWVPNTQSPPGIGHELEADILCVADAQFAWGVNRVIWHGKPYETKSNPQQFYATVHVSPHGQLASSLLHSNTYLESVCSMMSRGKTYSRMGVYFPLEDQWMKDELPAELLKPSSNYYWELQEVHMPDALLPYRPLWISGAWLEDMICDGGKLSCGAQTFPAFLVDAEWMQYQHLKKLVDLTVQGAPIIWKRFPKEPGYTKHTEYTLQIRRLAKALKLSPEEQASTAETHLETWNNTLPAAAEKSLSAIKPLLKAPIPLDFWCRKTSEGYYLFISHPGKRKLRYPMPYGYGNTLQGMKLQAEFYDGHTSYPLELSFQNGNSLLLHITL